MYSHDNPELAETYDRLSDSQYQAGTKLVGRLALKPGDRVLDVGCGTGRLAEWIFGCVGVDGAVVGIDPLAERIAIARKRSPHIRFEVAQAENLSLFGDESFDALCLSAVFHWVQDKPKALDEIARVLRKGARMGITTLPSELQRAGTLVKVCGQVIRRASYRERLDFDPYASGHTGPTVTETIQMLTASGLELLELHVVQTPQLHESGREVIDHVESSSFGNFLSRVPPELRETFQADLAKAFDELKGPTGILVQKYGTMIIAARP